MKAVKSISDIAKLAGVSKSTVSRALNDSSLINQETKERIQAIAKEHQFEINYAARNLSLKQSNTIALIAIAKDGDFKKNYNDPFFLEFVGAITNTLAQYQYDLLVGQYQGDLNSQLQYYLDTGRVDGVIITSCLYSKDEFFIDYDKDYPLIIWGSTNLSDQYCTVKSDNVKGGLLATSHLFEQGCKKIAFLGGRENTHEVIQRFQGYQEAFEKYKMDVDPELIIYSDYTCQGGYQSMSILLEKNQDIDGVFANSDLMAIGAFDAIRKIGKRIPQDIKVVGFDNIPLAAYCHPTLSTINQNIAEVGKTLVDNLMTNLQDNRITSSVLPVELIVRKSSS
ncbi:MAG: LacI family transcriptional regulator [Spirochaetes bacterium]|nr:LacI family transcriptional regulator [Spirochaetota bacterium]